MGKLSATYRWETSRNTDTRVRLINEVIKGIQMIKMYLWESHFAQLINKARKDELKAIRGSSYILAFIFSFLSLSKFTIFLSILSYIYSGSLLTARKYFIVSSFYGVLNEALSMLWPLALTQCAEGWISLKRLKQFLLLSEKSGNFIHNISLTQLYDGKNELCRLISPQKHSEFPEIKHNHEFGVNFEHFTASRFNDNGTESLALIDVTVRLNKPLNGIVGSNVGSGKSTLLQALLGELNKCHGIMNVNGLLSYASQEPWLFNGSIKRNIIFVDVFNEKRYNQVLKVCCLETDLDLLPLRDETIVGERGAGLSGGQKARINLARSIYREADIYLLDDPLAALDNQVCRHIFQKCFKEFLKNKIVILVTNQLHLLEKMDQVITMSDGTVISQRNIQRNEIEFNPELKLQINDNEDQGKVEKQSIESLIEGSVKSKVYKEYFNAVGSSTLVCLVFILRIFSQFIKSGFDYCMAQWVNWEENIKIEIKSTNATSESYNYQKERQSHIHILSIAMSILVIFVLNADISFFYICLRASKNLHENVYRGVSNTFISFFKNNSSGRILNRFSRDIGNVDASLPSTLFDSIVFILEFLAVVSLVGIVRPWLIIPTAIMGGLLYGLRYIYINTSRSIKRIEAATKSPIFAHVNGTLQGITTIRSCGAEDKLIAEFSQHQNKNMAAYFIFINIKRAFSLWLDVVCVIYIGIVTFSFVEMSDKNIESGNIGLAITQVIKLIGMCQWGIKQTAELENQMISVERLIQYSNLPSELDQDKNVLFNPEKSWPVNGSFNFDIKEMKYSENSEAILKDVQFIVKPKEKICIVGKTGAGKSSLIQALFRLVPVEGFIEIDGIKIEDLSLETLRKTISIIPQTPFVFSGSLRTNLDPLGVCCDSELWDVIEQVDLKKIILHMEGGLDCRVNDSGSNFSLGQKQLLCLARVLLQKNRIIIMDEPTSNIDQSTDYLIQNIMRNKFKNCTVLTIAHRLATIMENDRVLVMNAGRVVEYGSPTELLQINNGFLKNMLEKNML